MPLELRLTHGHIDVSGWKFVTCLSGYQWFGCREFGGDTGKLHYHVWLDFDRGSAKHTQCVRRLRKSFPDISGNGDWAFAKWDANLSYFCKGEGPETPPGPSDISGNLDPYPDVSALHKQYWQSKRVSAKERASSFRDKLVAYARATIVGCPTADQAVECVVDFVSREGKFMSLEQMRTYGVYLLIVYSAEYPDLKKILVRNIRPFDTGVW